MARRSVKKRKSSSLGLLGIIGGGIVLLLGVIFLFPKGSEEKVASQFPLEEYLKRGSTLRDNEYVLLGRVENQDSTEAGELITLVIPQKEGKENKEARLPILVEREVKNRNIEREQKYRFYVRVENRPQAKGLLVATKVELP